jgi:hypothetical protein
MLSERRLFFATSWLSRSTKDDITKFRSEVGVAIFRSEVGVVIFHLNLDFDTPPNYDPPVQGEFSQ